MAIGSHPVYINRFIYFDSFGRQFLSSFLNHSGKLLSADSSTFEIKIESDMKVTYYGHSCFSVHAGGKQLLFDPFISGNELAKAIDIEEIDADYIFVSHGHFDHILDVLTIAGRTHAKVVASWELCNYFGRHGLKNLQPLNPGGKISFDFGDVKAVIAQHSSSFAGGEYAGVVSGFAVKTADGSFYYSGDTALTVDMTLIPKWVDLDFAVFPIGDVLTMGMEDAIIAAGLVSTKKVMGVHYDTFEPIKINRSNALREFEKAGLQLYLPAIGTTIDIDKNNEPPGQAILASSSQL
jgi:L-ascorbate metabolism protein UlaG (beta-lactamase superfamily)